MAGRGRPPKRPQDRARSNPDPVPVRTVTVEPVRQPLLTELFGRANPATGAPWTRATVELWESLAGFPATEHLQGPQWKLLGRAMMLDDAVVSGQLRYAPEARLQLAKFGIAPDDVARMRIVFSQADDADDKAARRRVTAGQSARSRYPGLRAVATD